MQKKGVIAASRTNFVSNGQQGEQGHEETITRSVTFLQSHRSTPHGRLRSQAQSLSVEELARHTIERRAVEAVIWGMPAVNYDLMLQQMLTKTDGKVNQVVYWGRPLDWHNQTLTPNPDAIYFMAFTDTRTSARSSSRFRLRTGALSRATSSPSGRCRSKMRGSSGADKGVGARYLILPPGYADPVPAGYIPLQSDTFGGYALLRSNLESHSDADVEKAIAYGKRVKVYPLSQAADPPATVFTDGKDVLFNSTIRYDASFFEGLNRIVQSEPWLQRDRAMIDQLRSLGIDKGKAFSPDAPTGDLLDAAALEAKAWLEAKYDAGFPPFFEGGHWTFPAPPEVVKAMQTAYADPDAYPIDMRGVAYSYAYVGIKRLGAGQFYLITIRDKDGAAFDGGRPIA